MHTFIIGFLQEHIQHTTVSCHIPQRTKVTNNGGNHTGNSGNSFEVDGTVEDFVLGDFTAVPSGGDVESKSDEFDGREG